MNFPSVRESTQAIENTRRRMLKAFSDFSKEGSPIYHQHFIIAGVLDRTLSNIHGFLTLSKEQNFLCCAAILRLQIDTAMRVNAFNLVDDPNALSEQIMKNKRFSEIVDRDGKQMKDWYLRKKLSEKHPWIDSVYEETSGAVHLSSRHIFASVEAPEGSEDSVVFNVTGLSEKPQEQYSEIFAAFEHSLRMTADTIFSND